MSVADEARAEAAKRWPSYPTVGFSGADDKQEIFRQGAKWQASRPITDEQVEAAAEVVCKALEDGRPCTNFHVHESHKRVARAALEAVKGVQS